MCYIFEELKKLGSYKELRRMLGGGERESIMRD